LTRRCEQKIYRNLELKNQIKQLEEIIQTEVEKGRQMRVQEVKTITEAYEKQLKEVNLQ
jgi:divalent metal cation (Fe/Co/Zn/Cd) transporter